MRTPLTCRVIEEDVRAHCVALGLGEAPTLASAESALIAHSAAAGKKTAERLLDKQRVREMRARA